MTSSAMRFFKVILSSTFHDGRLKIPKKFVNCHGDEIAECVTLSVPSGCSWSVKIQREVDSSIWLHNGLLKFMEDNSIGVEFFVTFEYRGGSKFSVLIFDLTATEIQYNCTNASATSDVNQLQNADIGEGSNDSQKAKDDDDSIEFLGSSASHLFPQRSTKPSKSVSTHNREKCFVRDTDNIKRCCLSRSKRKMLDRGIMVDGSGGNISLKDKGKNKSDGSSTSQRGRADGRTIEAENLSFSTTFTVTLKSYNIQKNMLYVPMKFARPNMPHSSRDIKLVDSDDNEWVVCFHYGTKCFLIGGWPWFVKNKNLIAGDVCTFERIQGNQVKLKVNIYRSADGKNSKMHKNATRFVGCDASPMDFNFFKVTLTPSYIRTYLNVPSNLALFLAPLNSSTLVKLVDADNKEWVVSFIHKPGISHRLSQGWTRFVWDKKLTVGDVCTFERVWGDEVKLKVTISRPVSK